jgi:hypothetical protein
MLLIPLAEFVLTAAGKTTVANLYEQFLDSLGVSGQSEEGNMFLTCDGDSNEESTSSACTASVRSRVPLVMKFADYSDEELLRILVRLINDRFKNKMKVEGGTDGLYSRILVHRVGRGRGKKNSKIYGRWRTLS